MTSPHCTPAHYCTLTFENVVSRAHFANTWPLACRTRVDNRTDSRERFYTPRLLEAPRLERCAARSHGNSGARRDRRPAPGKGAPRSPGIGSSSRASRLPPQLPSPRAEASSPSRSKEGLDSVPGLPSSEGLGTGRALPPPPAPEVRASPLVRSGSHRDAPETWGKWALGQRRESKSNNRELSRAEPAVTFPCFQRSPRRRTFKGERAGGSAPPTPALPLPPLARASPSVRSRLSGAREELSRRAFWEL